MMGVGSEADSVTSKTLRVQEARRWLVGLFAPSSLKGKQLALLLLSAATIIFLRAPRLLLEGRVLAEEGTTYLRYAWNARPLAALLAPHQGYYSLFDNALALIAARVLPLSATALWFTWSAFAVQMLTCYLVISCDMAHSLMARALALLSLLLASASLGVWLSVENAQFFLPICVALVLIGREQRVRAGHFLLLLVAGLTGVTSCAFVPLYWVKAGSLRTRAAIWQAALLSSTTLIQGLVVWHSLHAGYRERMAPNFEYLGPVLLQRTFLLPFFTNRAVISSNNFFASHPALLYIVLAWLVFAASLAGLASLLGKVHRRLALLMAAAFVSAAFNWTGCYHCDNLLFRESAMYGTRYFFIENALLNVSLSLGFMLARRRSMKLFTGGLLALTLLSGGFQFLRYRDFLTVYPSWRGQVAAWRLDDRTPILVAPSWPYPLRLPRSHPNLNLPAGVYDSSNADRLQ